MVMLTFTIVYQCYFTVFIVTIRIYNAIVFLFEQLTFLYFNNFSFILYDLHLSFRWLGNINLLDIFTLVLDLYVA